MPSRQPPPPAAPPMLLHRHHAAPNPLHLVAPLTATAATISVLLILAIVYRKLTRKRTAPGPPSDHQQNQCQRELRHFPFQLLRRSTSSFSTSNRLGQGGFGSVFRGVVPSTGEAFAVKVMDCAGSLQGEREFQNELAVGNRINSYTAAGARWSSSDESRFVVSILGYSSDRRGQRKLIVYELMENGSLQDKLLDQKCEELMEWKKRFSVVLDIAKALRFLHTLCGPTPVIHGDVKASNVLLDGAFNAKLGDFGLARVLEEEEDKVGLGQDVDEGDSALVLAEIDGGADGEVSVRTHGCGGGEDPVNGSVAEDTESLATGFVEDGLVERSPESCTTRTVDDDGASPETAVTTELEMETAGSCLSECCNTDKVSVEEIGSRKGVITANPGGGRKRDDSGRYWWWKQESSGGGVGSESGRIKDYVMEWIKKEIKKERPKSTEWTTTTGGAASISAETRGNGGNAAATTTTTTTLRRKIEPKKKQWKRFNWWASLDCEEEPSCSKKEKDRISCRKQPREWWREEFCEELTRKKKKKKKRKSDGGGSEMWWQREDDFVIPEKKRRGKSRTSLGSIDWWLDGLSGELRSGRRNSQDWVAASGDNFVPKSGGISSTPSMRGTVCYIAPEYGGGDQLSEKCDVYSFGVLVLVIVSGRRPLQVMASPMSEFERANLISWARQLAHNGKLLDLVDPLMIQSLDKEQVLLCITIALLCLQRSPSKRPNMKEVVDMLTGEAEVPHLPFEFSPSPPSNFPFKSRKKAR